MDKTRPDANILISLLRASRLAVHFLYGTSLAAIYPYFGPSLQRRIMQTWSRQLLDVLNIVLRIEGQQPAHGEGGCLMIANHVSWLDIFVLNAICPARFIAKSEVRDWPVIGWLCRRCDTIFIERAMRQGASSINRQVGVLLEQGVCVGLFPEGTTTDGKQVGHFYSALLQPAIDTRTSLRPIALRYLNLDGDQENAAVFIGDMTLMQSIWQILRCPRQHAMAVFTPVLMAHDTNRRTLARSAQDAITAALQSAYPRPKTVSQQELPDMEQVLLASQSIYPLLNHSGE